MERVQVLIDKLVEQKQQNASAAQMLVTVQLLQKELLTVQQKSSVASTSKVTVVMPSGAGASGFNNRTETIAVEQPKPIAAQREPELQKPVEYQLPTPEPPYKPKEEYVEKQPPAQTPVFSQPVEATAYNKRFEPQPQKEASPEPVINNEPVHPPFDPIAETPTLLHHQPVKEVYELIMEPKESQSLNDKLKQEKVELGQVLKETPIKDLRKAIGINDKFLFVNELFRGDEAMYDRSIKTINNFGILPEAEYWINRELKVKLGWNDGKEVVQHFYQLVRRRFS